MLVQFTLPAPALPTASEVELEDLRGDEDAQFPCVHPCTEPYGEDDLTERCLDCGAVLVAD